MLGDLVPDERQYLSFGVDLLSNRNTLENSVENLHKTKKKGIKKNISQEIPMK